MPTSAAFVRTLLEHLQRSHQFSPTIHTIPNGLAARQVLHYAECESHQRNFGLWDAVFFE